MRAGVCVLGPGTANTTHNHERASAWCAGVVHRRARAEFWLNGSFLGWSLSPLGRVQRGSTSSLLLFVVASSAYPVEQGLDLAGPDPGACLCLGVAVCPLPFLLILLSRFWFSRGSCHRTTTTRSSCPSFGSSTFTVSARATGLSLRVVSLLGSSACTFGLLRTIIAEALHATENDPWRVGALLRCRFVSRAWGHRHS